MQANEITITSTKAINDECTHAGLEYAELSPQMRTLVIKCYVRGAKDILQKIRESEEEIIKKL